MAREVRVGGGVSVGASTNDCASLTMSCGVDGVCNCSRTSPSKEDDVAGVVVAIENDDEGTVALV